MKLARKFTAALIVGIAFVMIANTLLRVHREVDLFERDQEHDQRVMGWTLRNAIQAVWETEDETRARAVLAMTDVNDLGVRWRQPNEVSADRLGGDADARRVAGTLAAGKEATVVRHFAAGDRRYTYVPMHGAHSGQAVLELSELASPPPSFIRASILENVLSTTLIIVVCSLIALTLGVWLVGRPMRLLTLKARRVGAGDFTGPLALRQSDEIGALAAEIDTMSEQLAEAQRRVAAEADARVAALEQLRHADRLKTIGQLASGVAHELGTPLNVVSGHAGLILADPTPVASTTGARIIIEQTERMARIIRHLLDFARRRGPHLVRHELAQVVADAVEILAPYARTRHVTIEVEAPGRVAAAVDPDQLLQAITNLMVNGMQSMARGGRLAVSIGKRRVRPPADHGGDEDDWACVTVADEGEGMNPETQQRVFEPFFTTKGVGDGTGLGLSVTWGIVQEHGGWIDVRSTVGAGSAFSVFLPDAAR